MTVSDYRAFGVCQKTVLAAGQSVDLRTPPGTYSVGTPAATTTGYKFMHVLVVGAANITYGLTFDIQSATTYTTDFTTQAQVAGVAYLLVNSGQVEVFFFA